MSAHEELNREEEIQGSSNRSFGIVFTIVFLIISLIPLINSGSIRIWSLVLAAIFLLASFIKPEILQPLNNLWTRFGLLLSKVMNPIILGLLFFLVVTPIGILMRIFSGNPMKPKFDPTAQSYWIKRDPPGPKPESLSDQF
ncbi:MAG: SxtJ family membrane protein [Nitrospinales bacterium]